MANVTVRVPSDGITHRHSQSSFFSWAPPVLGLMVLPMGEPERTSEGQDLLHKRVVFNAPFTGPIIDPGALERAKCLGGLRNAVRAVPLFSVHLLLDRFPNIEKKVRVATGGGHLKSVDPHTLWAQRTGA